VQEAAIGVLALVGQAVVRVVGIVTAARVVEELVAAVAVDRRVAQRTSSSLRLGVRTCLTEGTIERLNVVARVNYG
jgi:hypothetical protein